MRSNNNIKKLTVTAMLCALAVLSIFILKFKVNFLSFDLKDAILSLIVLTYGLPYGLLSVLAVALLETALVSDTGVYGLIMNMISSGAFVLAVGTVYRYKRSFAGAILAAITAVISVTVIMMLANMLITPYYMGTTVSQVVQLIPSLLLPFNLAKSIMNASVMLMIYKPITELLRQIGLISRSEQPYKFGLKALMLTAITLILLVASTVFIVLALKGSIIFL